MPPCPSSSPLGTFVCAWQASSYGGGDLPPPLPSAMQAPPASAPLFLLTPTLQFVLHLFPLFARRRRRNEAMWWPPPPSFPILRSQEGEAPELVAGKGGGLCGARRPHIDRLSLCWMPFPSLSRPSSSSSFFRSLSSFLSQFVGRQGRLAPRKKAGEEGERGPFWMGGRGLCK